MSQKASPGFVSNMIAKAKPIYHALRNPFEIRKRIKGQGNRIFLGKSILRRVRITIEGNNNTIDFSSGCLLQGLSINIRGNGHRLTMDAGGWCYRTSIVFEDENCLIEIGPGCLLNKMLLAAVETGCAIRLGSKVGLSEEVDVRTSDSHSIVDVATGKRLNPPGDITIGDGVWVGKGATILKGVTLGEHCVVGMRSVVTKNIPPYSLAVGIPAKVIRSGVTWAWEKLPY